MKSFFTFIIISILFLNSSPKLTEQERNFFLQKLTYKITPENLEKDIDTLKIDYLKEADTGIKYDKAKIDALIEKYKFPTNFNFLEENNIKPIVKNQQKCGSCWAHSSSSALSYRYKKAYNIDIDLSPQDALSCYFRDCSRGSTILDAQLNLIRNGSLTEECFPFVSSDGGTIPDCPNKCVKDGTEFIKYKAKNIYLTRDYYSEKNYYDIVTLIMDQLQNYGPVVSQIVDHRDFEDLHNKEGDCKDYIYKYDGVSEYVGGHGVTIVGYGLKDNRYYWLVQNSWGENFCDKGFIKIEFGQIGIEKVSFAEPYLPNKESIPTEIDLTFDSVSEYCKLNIKADIFNLNNSFEVNFEKINNNNNDDVKEKSEIIKFICGKLKDQDNKESLNCYCEELKNYPQGEYQFKNLSSLGSENIFTDKGQTFNGKKFKFTSFDLIFPTYHDNQLFFISEKGSKIIFSLEYYGNENITKYIYPSASNEKSLKNCQRLTFSKNTFVYCELDSDEIEYFNYPNQASDNPIVYKSHCGKISSRTIAYRINKNEHPVFKVKRVYTKKGGIINKNMEIKLVTNVEGSISGFNKNQEFAVFGKIQRDSFNINDVLYICQATKPESIEKDHIIICKANIKDGDFTFEYLFMYPYYIPLEFDTPYEIFINKEMQVDELNFSKYLRNPIVLFLSLLIFL